MNITLKPEQQKLIQARIESGKYSTVEEIITAALQLLEERDRKYENWIAETQPKVAMGIAELERGEGIDGEVVIAKLREKFRQMRDGETR